MRMEEEAGDVSVCAADGSSASLWILLCVCVVQWKGFLLWCESNGNHDYFKKPHISAGTVSESTSLLSCWRPLAALCGCSIVLRGSVDWMWGCEVVGALFAFGATLCICSGSNTTARQRRWKVCTGYRCRTKSASYSGKKKRVNFTKALDCLMKAMLIYYRASLLRSVLRSLYISVSALLLSNLKVEIWLFVSCWCWVPDIVCGPPFMAIHGAHEGHLHSPTALSLALKTESVDCGKQVLLL